MNKFIKEQNTRTRIISYLGSKGLAELTINYFRTPSRLFRYSGINKYLIANLKFNTLTITDPSLFNDVYDASLHRNSFSDLLSDELERRELLEICGMPDTSPVPIDKLRSKAEHEDKFLSQYMKEALKVGCLSENHKSILMWSHYADKNQGICIEYDFTGSAIYPFMYPVIYLENPIDCSELCDTHLEDFNIDMAMLLSTITKSTVWKYEKEWRVICYYSTKSSLNNSPRIYASVPKPKAIYLGRSFLQYWLDHKRCKEKVLFDRLCKFIRENQIETFVMKNKLLSYELYPVIIDIDIMERLNEDELYDDYLV